jgi:hypothetical protein
MLRPGWMPAPSTAAIGSILAASGLLGAGGAAGQRPSAKTKSRHYPGAAQRPLRGDRGGHAATPKCAGDFYRELGELSSFGLSVTNCYGSIKALSDAHG